MLTFAASGDGQLRLPDAAGFLGEYISRQGIGPCPRSAADLAELTNAAFPFQVCAVTQGDKERRMSVDLRQRLLAYVSSGDGQEPGASHRKNVDTPPLRGCCRALRSVPERPVQNE